MHRTLAQAAHWLLQSAVDGQVDANGSSGGAASIGWLKSAPLKALHPFRWQLCIAALGRLALVPLKEDFGHTSVSDIRPTLRQVCAPPEHITAVAWACFDGSSGQGSADSCLLVGTSSGHLLLLSEDGDLLHRQRLHTTALTGIALRAAPRGAHDASEDVTLCFEDAVARFTSLELRSLVALRKKVGHFSKWPALGCNKWDTSRGAGPRSGAHCSGVEEPGLYAVMTGRDTGSQLLLLTVGRGPPVAAFKVREHAVQGTLALVGDVAANVVAGVAGIARAAVLGRDDGYRAGLRKWLQPRGLERPAPPTNEATKEEPPPAGEPAALWRSLQDEGRTATALLAAPRGTLAVAADSLGRVLLLDSATATVLRVFKGYRAAQCAWLSLPLQGRPPQEHAGAGAEPDLAAAEPAGPDLPAHARHDRGAKRSRHVESGASRRDAWGGFADAEEASEQQQQLCLALHAPWREVIDVWAMTHGGKLCSLAAGPDCCVLSAPPVFGRAAAQQQQQSGSGAGEGGAGTMQQSAWMLNCASGKLWSLEGAAMQALGMRCG